MYARRSFTSYALFCLPQHVRESARAREREREREACLPQQALKLLLLRGLC
jgi:hypothetical protein